MTRLVPVVLLVMVSSFCMAVSEYDIVEVFKKISVPSGAVVLTSSGDLEEAEGVFVPTRLDEGTYKVTVTRREANLYEVDGLGIYIQTRYCYEYGYSEEAILKYTPGYGFSRGELIFLD